MNRDGSRPALRLITGTAGEPTRDRLAPKRALLSGAALVAAGCLALLAQGVPQLSPVRPVLAFGFVLFAPGAAVVLRLPLVSRLERLAVTIGLSVAIAIPVSEAYAFAHAWSATAVLATLTGITAAVVAVRQRPAKAATRTEWRPLYGPYPIDVPVGRAS